MAANQLDTHLAADVA